MTEHLNNEGPRADAMRLGSGTDEQLAGGSGSLLRTMFNRPVVKNAVRVSLLVGTCLNLINQGAALWAGAGIVWGKIILNYLVPYLVASYSAAKVCRSQGPCE